ncbi:Signal peptidase I [Streptococcus sp. DD11]|uniref:signal peptidase I n=1 Tax=Streptococcus sp. DD11 TaxID=1777879 RepID=UPI000798DF0A|nr:signal peptidase I [Streptococcus sp. DD11]KXT79363.1 Signal peptidase I [Streptococcus sp. DD11]
MVKRDLLRNIIIFSIIAAIVIGLRIFIYTPYRVTEQDSNSYLAENDLVLATRKQDIKRGDFVLYEVDGKDYVGRVIALEKDQVTYMDNLLYLNGQVMSEEYIEEMREKYLASAASTGYYTHDFSVQELKGADGDRVARASYLVLNDRRENNKDSREFGLIKADQIKGVVEFRLSPLSKFGFIKNK